MISYDVHVMYACIVKAQRIKQDSITLDNSLSVQSIVLSSVKTSLSNLEKYVQICGKYDVVEKTAGRDWRPVRHESESQPYQPPPSICFYSKNQNGT